jgi:hypothetical protein
VIEGFVHGQEEGDNFPPLGEILVRGRDFEIDVVSDVDVSDVEGRSGRDGWVRCWGW